MLYPKGHGYPLWTPEPNREAPPEYREGGIKVGDVGFITRNGGFEFLFNITLPENHDINKWRGVPENFVSLDLVPEGFSTIEDQILPGDTILSKGTEIWDSGPYFNVRISNLPIGVDIGFQLRSRHSEGAALLLPQGASETVYMAADCLCNSAAAHAETWYRYCHKQGYSDIQNGSLYIISGFLKTACYHTAV
ncbi:hypothetical protein K435DRAFT_702773, partial [Dendrothele bispora CBS 962.96]